MHKCLPKRAKHLNKKIIYNKHRRFRTSFYPDEVKILKDNVRASVTNSMSVCDNYCFCLLLFSCKCCIATACNLSTSLWFSLHETLTENLKKPTEVWVENWSHVTIVKDACPKVFNIPCVAGAVLQSASSLTDYLINKVSDPFPPDLQNIINPKPIQLESWNF